MTIVAGYCPMGCGTTLRLGVLEGEVQHVICSNPECPNQTAVAELLSDSETEHVVEVGENAREIKHPLRERLDNELFGCPLHTHLNSHSPDQRIAPGRYRVTQVNKGFGWEPIN